MILQRKVVRATTSESGCELTSKNLLAEYGRSSQRERSLDGRRLGMNVSLTSVIGVDVLLTVIKTVVTGFAIRTPYGLRTSSMARG